MNRILPYILATLTQHNRQKVVAGVDFQWHSTWEDGTKFYSLISIMFRLFELIFWRKEGIKCEASSAVGFDEAGKKIEVYRAHSIEAALTYLEIRTRAFLRGVQFPKLIKVYVPHFAPATGLAFSPSPYLFAIAFDATAQGTSSGAGVTDITWSHTMGSVSNGLLITGGYGQGSSTSGTYNGSSMTLIQSVANGFGGPTIDSYYKVAPTSGAHNAVINYASTQGLAWGSISYSGCAQTGVPDSMGSNSSGAATSISASTTVVASNCWIFGTCGHDVPTNDVAFTTGTTRQQAASAFQSVGVGDSNATVGTGSQSFGATFLIGRATINIASFAPVSTTVNSGFFWAAAR